MAEEAGLVIDPMHQFQIHPLFGGHEIGLFTVTNQTLWLGITVVAIALFMIAASASRALVPGRLQSMGELVYGFVHDMVEEVAGHDGVKFFPYVMALFTFILFSNLLGLLPMSFSTTSHVAVTVALALMVFLTVTLVGLYRKGLGFLSMFWVSSAPLVLRPVLAVIEVISYFVRPLSHSVRLAGNMMAGHAVLKVFAGFAGALGIGAFLPILAITGMYGLELMVAVIQAYVFAILTCVYLNDALHTHH